MIKVYMGIPSMGDRVDHQVYQLREIEKRYAGEVELVYPERCVHRFMHDFARNEIVEEFLESDCDILWFLDCDIVPAPHVLDLITIHDNKGWLAAGAPYPLWLTLPATGELGVCFTAYKGNAPDENGNKGLVMSQVPRQGTEWVDGLATGCLFLKRELFEKLEKPYFQFKRKQESQEVIEGEDLGFALKLQKLGIKYFCDHGMVCGHYKKTNLLEVQNYATSMSNAKITAYHEQVKADVTKAVQEAAQIAAQKGYQAGYAAAMKESGRAPTRTKTGLILPSQI